MSIIKRVLLFLCLGLAASCNPSNQEKDQQMAPDTNTNKYAEGFRIEALGANNWKLEIIPSRQLFYLVPKGKVIPEELMGKSIIRTPVERIVCTSTTHIPLLDLLNTSDALVGFPNPDLISSPIVRNRIDKGLVTDLGMDHSINMEGLLELSPEVVMAYSINANQRSLKQVESLGIPVLYNHEFLETHALGRAEWIRVAGVLFDRSNEADSIFTAISNRYNRLRERVAPTNYKPTVFSGVLYGDSWFLPGGKNYAAQLLNDAGLAYLWNSNESQGFLELSFESVLEKAQTADYWIGVANFESLSDLRKADQRYSLFEAFQKQQVYTYDVRKGPTGGSEYLELGYLRPDIILSDLIRIAHPKVEGLDSLYFHAKLPE